MKKVIILMIALNSLQCIAQKAEIFFFNTLENSGIPLAIDTAQLNNIWQIGTPQKAFFEGSFSPPLAIMTDTINSYPTNNFSSFTLSCKIPEYIPPTDCVPEIYFSFSHKIESDSLVDGGMVELSIDGSDWFSVESFNNFGIMCYDWYDIDDTVETLNKPGFSGTINQVKSPSIDFTPLFTSDSLEFKIRFTFASDDVNTDKAGWVLDNFEIMYYDGMKVNTYTTNSSAIKTAPNPTKNSINIEAKNNFIQKIEIYTNGGTLLEKVTVNKARNYQLDLSKFLKGIYYLKIYTGDNIINKKIVKL